MEAKKLKELFDFLPPLPGMDSYWLGKRHEIRERIKSGEDPEDMLKWSPIRATMWVDAPYTMAEYDELWNDDKERWSNVFEMDELGEVPISNLIHQAYHVMRWEQYTKHRISDLKTIVEIGGGYGAMARVARAVGFSGKYYIYDLPEFTLLQKYYLNKYRVPVHHISYEPGAAPKQVDLLIGLWSLSEMSPQDKDIIAAFIRADHVLLSYNDVASTERPLPLGKREEIEHIPGNYYILR